jgi:hypothetical protein
VHRNVGYKYTMIRTISQITNTIIINSPNGEIDVVSSTEIDGEFCFWIAVGALELPCIASWHCLQTVVRLLFLCVPPSDLGTI